MNQLDSVDFGAVVQSTKVWASRGAWVFGILSVVATLLLVLGLSSASVAGSLLLWCMIGLSLSVGVAGYENTIAGYALLVVAFLLQTVAPATLTSIMGASATNALPALAQAAGFPMVIGILMVIKDLVTRLMTGLALKRVEVDLGTVLYAENLMDQIESDTVRQYHKYRLLVVPTLIAGIALYLVLLNPIRASVIGSLRHLDSFVSQASVQASSPTASNIQQGSTSPINASTMPGVDNNTKEMITKASSELAEPAFVNVMLAAFGIMFVTQILSVLEWAIYQKQW